MSWQGIRVDPERGQGVWTSLENKKSLGFLSNTDSDPMENHKATKQAFDVGPSDDRPASETA